MYYLSEFIKNAREILPLLQGKTGTVFNLVKFDLVKNAREMRKT